MDFDELWGYAWRLAAASGCTYPHEVAGVAVRLKTEPASAHRALTGCDACCDCCTAIQKETDV